MLQSTSPPLMVVYYSSETVKLLRCWALWCLGWVSSALQYPRRASPNSELRDLQRSPHTTKGQHYIHLLTANMHSVLVRAQNVFGFLTTVAFSVAILTALSVIVIPQNPTANIELRNVQVYA